MDDYTLQEELETLAGNAFVLQEEDSQPEPIVTTAARWQKLFDISQDAAIDRIMAYRLDLTRTRISEIHWEMVRSDAEAAGFDREAYEYDLSLQKKKALIPDSVPATGDGAGRTVTYLVEMSGPIDTIEKIRDAAGMENDPPVVRGISMEEGGLRELCCIDGPAKASLLRWVSEKAGGFEPTILADPRSLR